MCNQCKCWEFAFPNKKIMGKNVLYKQSGLDWILGVEVPPEQLNLASAPKGPEGTQKGADCSLT